MNKVVAPPTRIPSGMIGRLTRHLAAGATERSSAVSLDAHWRVAMVLLTMALLPPLMNAQACRGNPTVGCTNSGAVCSPVIVGSGSAGKCMSPAGLPKGERTCECTGTTVVVSPPPLMDPRCSSRTAIGTWICTINEPNVTQAETAYPAVVFAPGDILEVNANGCVQTGGHGATWKRYVNPGGDNSDRLYHGLIRIPTGTPGNGLVRIQSIVSNPFVVTGTGVPESQLFLDLGYEDDNYSDNGYTDHDNGTDNQCLTDPTKSFDGTPAHITVTISRGVTPPPPSSTFPFDVLWTELDPNGLPYNPQWSWQLNPQNGGVDTPHVPSTSICHNFSERPTFIGIPDNVLQPAFEDCTDQADATTVDLPQGSNATLCDGGGLFTSDSFAGHVNWFPVTMEGNAGAVSHSGAPYPFGDDDYTFEFLQDAVAAPLSVNGADGLHVEFDSDETIDNFTSIEWVALHEAVDNVPERAAQLFQGHTIVTGMFGLDGEHDLKSELHPLYAIATRRSNFENDPSDDAWLMFVRNQGDEGYCSSGIWYSGFQNYTFRLPWLAGMTSVSVNWAKTNAAFQLTAGATGPTVLQFPPSAATAAHPAGVYVTFHLGPPVPRTTNFGGDPGGTVPFVDGVLHLIWAGPRGIYPTPVNTQGLSKSSTGASKPAAVTGQISAAEDADEVENRIGAAVSKLTPKQQLQVKNARLTRVTKPVATHKGKGAGPVKKLTRPPAVPNAVAMHAIKGPPATRKMQRDAASLKALCAASKNRPAGLPATACTTK